MMRIYSLRSLTRAARLVGSLAWAASFVVACAMLVAAVQAQTPDPVQAAQSFRKGKEPVKPTTPGTIVCEAEEFQVQSPGWKAQPFGTNYFAATFANSFLSRKAYLGAPPQCEVSQASIEIDVAEAGKYVTLVRYEAPYRFESQFKVRVEQGGKVVLDRLYGSRDNLRIWAFREKLKKEVAWPWGAGENVVWEGHDAYVELQPGRAKITLIAGKQPELAGKRNVDLVLLTSDLSQVQTRLAKENYLPLDGMLTQADDVFLKLHNRAGGGDVKLTIPNGTEHSPYWVHMRTWKPKVVAAKPGESSDWIEVGSLLDSLAEGQWTLTAAGKNAQFDLEFGVKNAAGKIESIRKFTGLKDKVDLAYEADTRYSRRIRLTDEVLYDLVDYLKKQPVKGTPPRRTIIYGYTFPPKPADAKYTQAREEFLQLMGGTALGDTDAKLAGKGKLIAGYIDVRGVATNKLDEHCKKLQAEGVAHSIATVSLGDEIGLASPSPKDHDGFRAWLKTTKAQPKDVDAAATSWEQVMYSPAPATAKSNPSLYYYSKIYAFRFGIRHLKERTDILRKYLPNAGIGANFSPHHQHMYLGDTHHWITLFRDGGMTMPWGEDYIWQVQVGTQQMNFIMVDMFRAGIEGKKDAKIHYYVMPHTPGNTTANWRRQFYGDVAHGAKVFNLFEFRPVQFAYTENHCSDPAMYQEIRKSFHELGRFEDVVQDGVVVPAETGLWCSEAADVWNDHRAPFDAAKRTLYIALRHAQLPLDFVVDGDDLKRFKVIYLCDAHVTRAGAQKLAEWVQAGGTLVATAGAGMFDEVNQPNAILSKLLGVAQTELEESPGIVFEKQDLPYAKPISEVVVKDGKSFPIFGVRAKVSTKGAKVLASFTDKTPAVTFAEAGKGRAYYLAFLPGLSYFYPALPKRPVDRGIGEDSYSHFIPEDFDQNVLELLGPGKRLTLPVECSAPRVETTVIRAKQGTIVPLVNWNAAPIKGLKVTVRGPAPAGQPALATGRPVTVERAGDSNTYTLDLEVADVLILRGSPK